MIFLLQDVHVNFFRILHVLAGFPKVVQSERGLTENLQKFFRELVFKLGLISLGILSAQYGLFPTTYNNSKSHIVLHFTGGGGSRYKLERCDSSDLSVYFSIVSISA